MIPHRFSRLLILLVIAWPLSSCADEMVIPNSTSPDGSYALYAIDAHEEFQPATLEIRSLKDQKPRIKLEAGGYLQSASSYYYCGDEDTNAIFVIWNPTGSRVAMMVRDGKRSGSLVICERKDDSFRQRTKSPDFSALAERELGLKRDGRYTYDFPQTWVTANKLSIKMRFDDVDLKDSKTYAFECSLEFDVVSGKTSKIKLLSKELVEG